MDEQPDARQRNPVAHAAAVLGEAAWVGAAQGEPVFAEPWEGRAFGLAFDLVGRAGGDWHLFRSRLIAAIAAEPMRPYFESWVVALEDLVAAETDVTAADLRHERQHAATYWYDEAGVGAVEVVPVPTTAGGHAEFHRPRTDDASPPWRFRVFDGDGVMVSDEPAPDGPAAAVTGWR